MATMVVESGRATALTEGEQGGVVRIEAVRTSTEDGCRLRELGVYEGAELTILTQGDPVIVAVSGTRFAICRRCAKLVTAVAML